MKHKIAHKKKTTTTTTTTTTTITTTVTQPPPHLHTIPVYPAARLPPGT